MDSTLSMRSYTWLDRIRTWAWNVSATMTGAFVVAILVKSGLMERAATTSLSWLAVIAAVVATIVVVIRTTPDATTP